MSVLVHWLAVGTASALAFARVLSLAPVIAGFAAALALAGILAFAGMFFFLALGCFFATRGGLVSPGVLCNGGACQQSGEGPADQQRSHCLFHEFLLLISWTDVMRRLHTEH